MGGNGVTLTLPNPAATDVWGALEYANLELSIVNLGTDALTLSRPVRLDADSTMTILNNIYPDNTIRIKCIGGEWVKIG